MSDREDELLSRYLDGELSDAGQRRLEQVLAGDERLRARLDALRRLQAMAAALPPARAGFDADDVRVRLGTRRPRGAAWRVGIAAAAVLALSLTHTGAFLLGGREAPGPAPRDLQPYRPLDTIAEAEGLFARAALLDPARQPADELRGELATLEDEFARSALPDRLTGLLRRPDLPRPVHERAMQLLDGWTLVEEAGRSYEDPGLRGLLVSRVARDVRGGPNRLRALPGGTESWVSASPLDDGRIRVRIVEIDAQGRPRVTEETGTIEELRARNVDVRLVSGD